MTSGEGLLAFGVVYSPPAMPVVNALSNIEKTPFDDIIELRSSNCSKNIKGMSFVGECHTCFGLKKIFKYR